jgi:hypothetical protein
MATACVNMYCQFATSLDVYSTAVLVHVVPLQYPKVHSRVILLHYSRHTTAGVFKDGGAYA